MIDSAFNYGITTFGASNIHGNTNGHNNTSGSKLVMDVNRNHMIDNQSKNISPVDYKPILPSGSGLGLSSQTDNSHIQQQTHHTSPSLYKLNMMSPTSPCRVQTIHQPHQYPPQPSSTGSASPNSNLSASASPTIFPSPSYSSSNSSQNDLTSGSSSGSSSGYSWNTYAGLSSRPQFPYAQYATDYYGNMSMSSAAAAAGAWFSTQDRLYQAWPTAAAAAAASSYGFPNLDDIAFQTQLQRRSIRCTCPNCTNEMSGLPPIVGPDERGRKQHICHIPGCERLYGKASHLKTHLRWHTGERPFLCLTCGKRFSRSDELQRHGRTHTNYRPYSCPICAKKFSRSDHLSKHKKTHFKDKKNKKAGSINLDKENGQGIVNIKKEVIQNNETLVKNTLIGSTNRIEEANNNNNTNSLNKIQDHQNRNSSLQMNSNSTRIINNNNNNSNIVTGVTGASLTASVNQMNFFKTEPTSSTSHTDIPSGYQPTSYSMYPPPSHHHHHHHHHQQNIGSSTTTSYFPQSHHNHHHQQAMSLFYNRNEMQSTSTNLTTSNSAVACSTNTITATNANNNNSNNINENSSEQIGSSKLQFSTTSSTSTSLSASASSNNNIVGGNVLHQQAYNGITANSNELNNRQGTGSTLIHSTNSATSTGMSASPAITSSSATSVPSYDPLHQVSHTNYHPSVVHQFKCPDYSTPYPDFSQNSMMSGYHHWPNYHHPQMNY